MIVNVEYSIIEIKRGSVFYMEVRTRPEITEKRIEEIRTIIVENPKWNRTRISQHICRLWGWQSSNGTLKDISCRDMLRSLDKAGKINLPAPKSMGRVAGANKKIKHLEHNTTPIECTLSGIRPISIHRVESGMELEIFKSYIDQYHYLKFGRTIGENMKYLIYSNSGVPISCLLFGSAAWSCKDRDCFIGWNKIQRSQGLSMMTNNQRFLIFPWVKVPFLASHILSQIAKRISDDWLSKYGHPIYCLETFVENRLFKAVCYRAANWVRIGSTTGRGRDGGHHNSILPIKDIYLYPLIKNWKILLSEERDADS